jgi:hypothetical protein
LAALPSHPAPACNTRPLAPHHAFPLAQVARRAFSAAKEAFPGIGKIKYDPTSKASDLTFKHYDAKKVIMGKVR